MDFSTWLNDKNSQLHWLFIKRLSANDTGLTGGHQVGIYIPKSLANAIILPITRTDIKNPDFFLTAQIDSHNTAEQRIRAIYYNSKKHENKRKGRDEQRLTRWNSDISNSPLQDVENTGALTVFAFELDPNTKIASRISVWICRDLKEENMLEAHLGEIIPGEFIDGQADQLLTGYIPQKKAAKTTLSIPDAWKMSFPSGEEIIDYLVKNSSFGTAHPDKQIMKRRKEEYKLFLEVESLHVLEKIQVGFESVDDFIFLANSVSNRRKSRSGRSLEIHLERIFRESGIAEFGTQCTTEGNKKPDFIFPSCAAYKQGSFPDSKLRMLAVKTTCKDRWRQILNEANRISQKHLFTLQEGVSLNQFNEMQEEGVTLVVPEEIHGKFPAQIRSQILTLNQFISEIKRVSY